VFRRELGRETWEGAFTRGWWGGWTKRKNLSQDWEAFIPGKVRTEAKGMEVQK